MKRKMLFDYTVDNVRSQPGPYGVGLYMGDTFKQLIVEFEWKDGEDILEKAYSQFCKEINYEKHSIHYWTLCD